MDFRSDPYNGDYDVDPSTVAGWGSGTLTNVHAQGAFSPSRNNPTYGSAKRRVLAAEAGKLTGDDDATLPIAFVSDSHGCEVGFWRFKKPSSATALNVEPPVLDVENPYIIDPDASCAPGMMLTTSNVDVSTAGFDKKADIVVLTPGYPDYRTNIKSAALYLHHPDPKVDSFTKVHFEDYIYRVGFSLYGEAALTMSDVNGDGRADLVMGVLMSNTTSSDVKAFNEAAVLVLYADSPPTFPYTFQDRGLLIRNLDFGPPYPGGDAWPDGSDACGAGRVTQGPSGIARTDVDNDGIDDILISSAGVPGIRYYQGVDPTTYQRMDDIATPDATGLGKLLVYDFTGDGAPDIIAIRHGKGCGGKPGTAYLLRNDGAGHFTSINPPMVEERGNFDWVTRYKNTVTDSTAGALWFQSNYGFLGGKHSLDGNFALWSNLPARSSYVSTGVAKTHSLTAYVPGLGNLVDVSVSQYATAQPRGTSIKMYMSADDGAHFEPLTDEELAGKKAHAFRYAGKDLRWKAVFSATPGVPSESALYAPASASSASLSAFRFRYRYAGHNRFSWSKLAYGQVGAKEYTFTASFDTPDMLGHLQALPLGGVVRGDAVGVETLQVKQDWDAGDRVSEVPQGDRRLFTGRLVQPDLVNEQVVVSRPSSITLTRDNINNDKWEPYLKYYMHLTRQLDAGVRRVRAGGDPNERSLLRDPGHASPVFLGAPAEDPNFMGAGYTDYAAQQAKDRQPMVLLGANDGMLHAFSARNGSELWGHVPYSVLPDIASLTQQKSDGSKTFRHQYLVDGPLTVADVHDRVDGWRTVAIGGQGFGTSSVGTNAYFAVDVTNDAYPVPLWEMREGPRTSRSCNPNPCTGQTCNAPRSMDAPRAENKLFFGEMRLAPGQLDPVDRGLYALLEAEHMDAQTQGTLAPRVDWRVVGAGAGGALGARQDSYIEVPEDAALCGGTVMSSEQACASATFPIYVEPALGTVTVFPLFRLYYGKAAPQFHYALDNNLVGLAPLTFFATAPNAWQWGYGPGLRLAPGEHQLTVFMREPGMKLDAVAVKVLARSPSNAAPETPRYLNTGSYAAPTCRTTCLADPDRSEWPQCGAGEGAKCCRTAGSEGACIPVSSSCSSPPSRTGQTFSTPAVGRVQTSRGDVWAAFFASGYNASSYVNAGRSVYMVDAYRGTPIASWNFAAPTSPASPDIEPTVPGGLTLVDSDQDGYVDRVYFGDLAGRLWKINVHATASLGSHGEVVDSSQYPSCVVFDAGDPNGGGPRRAAPIVTRPAVAMVTKGRPNVYFGTGGSDEAPTNLTYSFYSVQDTDAENGCMATPRRAAGLDSSRQEWVVTEPAGGGQFWADPTVADNTGVYFASALGDPASTNPCVATSGTSHVYGVAIRRFVDARGVTHAPGTSLLRGGVAYLGTKGIVRSGPMVRGAPSPQVVRSLAPAASQPSDVLLQSNTDEVLRVSTLGVTPTSKLRLKPTRYRWLSLPH